MSDLTQSVGLFFPDQGRIQGKIFARVSVHYRYYRNKCTINVTTILKSQAISLLQWMIKAQFLVRPSALGLHTPPLFSCPVIPKQFWILEPVA